MNPLQGRAGVDESPRKSNRARQLLYLATVLWAASLFWMAEHPPMGDLAQHAGQVILLRDLIAGTSPWADLVRINLVTPYLVGYGLALPLSMVFPIAIALKILLSCAYVCFVAMAVKLRRHLGGDARLDWLFLPGFFGFAMGWGFLTFLVATPIALAMLYVADLHARRTSLKSSILVFAVGLLLLMSHGLAFCFGWSVAFALALAQRKRLRGFAETVLPLLLLLVPFVGYALYSQKLKLELQGVTPPGDLLLEYSFMRFAWVLRDSLTGSYERFFTPIAFVMMLMPWFMGMRIAHRDPSRWVPFAVTLLVLLLVPQLAMDTWGLYPRYALFLMPTYAWMFVAPVAADATTGAARLRAGAGEAVLAVACLGLLSLHSVRMWRFDREEADFRTVMAAAEPAERALSLVYDRASVAVHHGNMYAHAVSWYQAEKQGYVDFNFAWHPPQIVRFRAGRTPMIPINFEAHPERFQWVRDKGDSYRYFFVRKQAPLAFDPFQGAACAPVRVSAAGEWELYERRACPRKD